jgi:hypothetical protein
MVNPAPFVELRSVDFFGDFLSNSSFKHIFMDKVRRAQEGVA